MVLLVLGCVICISVISNSWYYYLSVLYREPPLLVANSIVAIALFIIVVTINWYCRIITIQLPSIPKPDSASDPLTTTIRTAPCFPVGHRRSPRASRRTREKGRTSPCQVRRQEHDASARRYTGLTHAVADEGFLCSKHVTLG